MKYSKIIASEKHIMDLMESIGIFRNHREFIELNHNPDYGVTPYKGSTLSTYHFNNNYKFPLDYSSVYDVSVHNIRIYHADDFANLKKKAEYSKLVLSSEDNLVFLNQCLELEIKKGNDSEFFDWFGCETEVNQFRLNNVHLDNVDLVNKRYAIAGSFQGDSSDIDPIDWAIYVEVEFLGLESSDYEDEFYSDLLVKAYNVYMEADYRTTFFLAYSAFEGFINQNLPSEKVEERLAEKLTQLFKNRFGDISRHQIYTTICGDFKKKLTPLRNDIAHGRKSDFTEEIAREMLIVSLLFISSYNNHADKVSDLLR